MSSQQIYAKINETLAGQEPRIVVHAYQKVKPIIENGDPFDLDDKQALLELATASVQATSKVISSSNYTDGKGNPISRKEHEALTKKPAKRKVA
jgi:hypothetical protein